MTSSPAIQSPPGDRFTRVRRFLWWAGVSLVIIVLGLLLSAWILTRPTVLQALFESSLSDRLGAVVEIEDAQWSGWSGVELTGVSIKAEDLQGPAAEVGYIDRLEAQLDFGHLVIGGSPLTSIVANGARLRIAENATDPYDVNVGRLFGGRDAAELQEIPDLPDRIELIDFVLEVGDFQGASWQPRSQRRFNGTAHPKEGTPGSYEIDLLEVVEDGNENGIQLHCNFSRINMSLESTVTSIDLEQDMSLLPGMFRTYCEQMDIEGDVQEITFSIGRGDTLRFAATLKDVGLSFPTELGLDEQWARFENQGISPETHGIPRMLAEHGELLYTDKVFKIVGLRGQFLGDDSEQRAAVKFNLDLAITDPDSEPDDRQDIDLQSRLLERLDRSTYRLVLRTDEFHLGAGPGEAVRADLPVIVAQILAMFQVRTCDVSINLQAHRSNVESDTDEFQYRLSGNVLIRDASGAYERFPYPLEQLDAHVEFDRDTVTVRSLDARGAGESRISIAGDVVPIRMGSEVNLSLRADSLPLDSSLLDAMPDEAAYTLRSLFGRHGALLPAGEGEHEVVDLDLRILRDSGPDHPTRLEGSIKFDDMQLTWDSFPYPILLQKGSLEWEGNTMSLQGPSGEDMIHFETPSGTDCVARGFIDLPVDDQQASGVLDLEVVGEPVTRDLVTALDRLSPDVADLIEALQIDGTISILGPVVVDSLGEVDYTLIIRINDATVRPRDHLARLIGAPDSFWSRGLELTDVSVELDATKDRVEIRSCSARAGEMQLSIAGTYHLEDPELTSIDVRVDGAPIQERLLRLASGDLRTTLENLYARWEPAGSMDLDVMVRGTGPGATTVSIDAASVAMQCGDVTEHLRIVGGMIVVGGGSLTMDDLELDALAEEELDGQYSLQGSMSWADEVVEADLRCQLVHGRFESPLLLDLAIAFAGEDQVRPYIDAEPRGEFDAESRVQRSHDAPWSWTLDATPRDIEARYDSALMQATFDGGSLQVRNGELFFDSLAGRFESGTFRISGDLQPGALTTADLHFDFEGRIRSPEILALIPSAGGEVLEGISFVDGQHSAMRGGHLVLAIDHAQGTVASTFEGDLLVDAASMEAGIAIDSITGRFGIRVKTATGEPTGFRLEGHCDAMKVLDRRLERIRIELDLDESGQVVRLVELSGDLAGGEVHAHGRCDLGEKRDWEAHVLIADAGLAAFMDMPSASSPDEPDKPLDGRLFASVSMSGLLDAADGRLGRGQIRIYDGAMQPLPFTVGLYQLLQFSMPVVDAPEYISIAYHSVGDEILLDRIRIESHMGDVVAFSLTGEGTYDWETQHIDAVLRPRSGWALLSDVFGALQDQFYAVGVQGPIEDPEVFIIPFPGMREEDRTAWVPPL